MELRSSIKYKACSATALTIPKANTANTSNLVEHGLYE